MEAKRKTAKVKPPAETQPEPSNATPEMDRNRVRQLIEEENPGSKIDDVELYCHQFLTYIEAAQNVLTNGTIVAHPRTAAPMENPYVKVRAAALGAMKRIKRLRKLDKLWTEARLYLDALSPPDKK